MRSVPPSHMGRGPVRSVCSQCGETGHTRRNRAKHPNLRPLGLKRDGGRLRYQRMWRESRALRATIAQRCADCGGENTRKRQDGEPTQACDGCMGHMNEQAKRRRREWRVFREALKAIADGWCLNPRDVAREALALGDQVKTRRAA